MDSTECLQDQLAGRYRDYLEECDLSELIDTLESLYIKASKNETIKGLIIDEIIYRDFSGHQDDEFRDYIG